MGINKKHFLKLKENELPVNDLFTEMNYKKSDLKNKKRPHEISKQTLRKKT